MHNKNFPNKIITSINKHYFKDILPQYKNMLLKFNKDIADDDYILIKKQYLSRKNIISIQINNKKYYSYIFFNFCEVLFDDTIRHLKVQLKKCNLDYTSISNIELFHWSDYSYDNTGKKRYPIKEFVEKNKQLLIATNNKLNNPVTIENIIDRVLFVDKTIPSLITYIIFVIEDNIIVYNKLEFIRLITENKFIDDEHLHIGPFVIQNKKRNLDYNIKSEYKRQFAVIRWFNYAPFIKQKNLL